MSLPEMIRATIVCGGIAFLAYSFPIFSQAIIITALSLLWLSYAYNTITAMRRD